MHLCVCSINQTKHRHDCQSLGNAMDLYLKKNKKKTLRKYAFEYIFSLPVNICETVKKKKEWWKNTFWLCSITRILVYTPGVDKYLSCLACRLLQPPLTTIDISFYANAAFGYVRTRPYFHRQSFIAVCLWTYGPRQNYCCTVHKLLSLCQEPLLHTQAADTHSRGTWRILRQTPQEMRGMCTCAA